MERLNRCPGLRGNGVFGAFKSLGGAGTRLLFGLTLLAGPVVGGAADSLDINQMRQQIERLKQQRLDDEKRLRELEQRLNQAEYYWNQRGKGLPTAAPATDAARQTQTTADKKTAEQTAAPSTQNDEPVKEAPATKSAQAVYQEQGALFDRRFTLETGVTYSRFDRKQLALNGFLALDSIFLGDIAVDEVKADILTFDILGRWGISDRLQVDVAAPLMWRRTVYQSGGVGGNAARLSSAQATMEPKVRLGDVSTGLYYQLRPETATRPDIVWNVRIKAPTGSDPYGVKLISPDPNNTSLIVPEELPSGNGVWAVSTGLSFVKTIDPGILFANIGYFYNFPRRFNDISATAGTVTPGKVDLGNSIQYGVGIAFALNERTSLSMSYTQRLTAKTRTKVDGGDWVSVTGSDANTAILNLGVTHALSDKTTMITNLGVGLTPDASDVQIGVKFPHTF